MALTLKLRLQLQSLTNDINVEIDGIIISYKNKKYIIACHSGLPIKHIYINNERIADYMLIQWIDLLIIPTENTYNTFVFKQFVKKQMDVSSRYIVDMDVCKFIRKEVIPIGMIPNNPDIMYNIMKFTENISNGITVCINNKLCGLVSKTENKRIYVIPINYILIALEKKNNIIYTLNEPLNDIYKLNNYKIISSNNSDEFKKVYCPQHKIYIPINTWLAINGDEGKSIDITLQSGVIKKTYYTRFENELIINSNSIKISGNVITITSGLLELLKFQDNTELIELIFSNLDEKKTFDYMIDSINYSFVY